MRCGKCGVENPDDLATCLACGAALTSGPATDVEIEVYDVQPFKTAPAPTEFERALAQARETALTEGPAEAGGVVVRDEVAQGYEIRRRRLGYRLTRPGNLILIAAALGLLVLGVVVGVRWAVDRMPKYHYPGPAHAAATERARAFAAALEETRVDPTPPAGAPIATLNVNGVRGKLFVNGNYVGDTPAKGLLVAPGSNHIVVKDRVEIALDETVAMNAGENYTLEAGAAPSLSAPLSGLK